MCRIEFIKWTARAVGYFKDGCLRNTNTLVGEGGICSGQMQQRDLYCTNGHGWTECTWVASSDLGESKTGRHVQNVWDAGILDGIDGGKVDRGCQGLTDGREGTVEEGLTLVGGSGIFVRIVGY